MGCVNQHALAQNNQRPPISMDQNALSRQLAVYGHETQSKLMEMRVLIHGLAGLGVQVAKNLILAGPKEVALFDNSLVKVQDLGSNFYLVESDVGRRRRSEALVDRLQQLNPNVQIKVTASDEIQKIIAAQYSCIVVLDTYDRDYLVNLNNECRKKGVGFIYGGNLGLYGFTFVDFGNNHKVTDPDGQQQKSIHVAGITKQEVAVVYLHDEKRHNLNDGDHVTFRQVKGMDQINGKTFKIMVKSPFSFTIGNTSSFGDYASGGIAQEVKMPSFFKFKSLQQSLSNPYAPGSNELPICNWQKMGEPEQLHVVINGLMSFWAQHKRLPRNLDKEDCRKVADLSKLTLGKYINKQGEKEFKVEAIDQKLVQNICHYAQTQISPVCSFWGGIITQQIVKLTGKYTPLRQWLHHQFFEVLPEQEVKSGQYSQTRYADYAAIFGDQAIEKLNNTNCFVVGAGALGCQFIKMFALMGMATGGQAKITVTDDDNIEISNLNRQFLFRRQHVGKNKSETACQVGSKINLACRFQPVKLKVGPDTEDYFNDKFWSELDFVVNAVDNVKARQYLDTQCVWYQKPFFESGTLGTKCHSQIIIPHKTISYNDIQDPPEQSIPLCTLKNFPYQIEHTIQWARDYFEGNITIPSQELLAFYEDKNKLVKSIIETNRQNPSTARYKLEVLHKLYQVSEAPNYQNCVELSVNLFYDAFYNQIAQLLHAFPEDHIIQETGRPFWSGLKRAPHPITLDLNDKLHAEVIQAAANIYATIFNIEMEHNLSKVVGLASKVAPVKFVPKRVKIEVDEKQKPAENVEINQEDQVMVKNLSQQLLKCSPNHSKKPTVVQFEKDDPTNWHIELMGGISNLRARNYKIEQVDNFKVKLIAGKIIPAIATTTAMIVGAIGIEILKYIVRKQNGKFQNATINLAIPMWVFGEPLPPIENTDKQFDPIMCGPVKAIPAKFTKWQKIDIKGPLTVEGVKNKIEKDYNIEVSMLTYGTSTIYTSFGQDSAKRLQMSIPEAIESLTKKQLASWRKVIPLGVSGSTRDNIECLMPDIRYFL